MARVLLFPAERRLGFIRRQIYAVSSYGPSARRSAVEGALTRQRRALARLVDNAQAEAHVEALRREIFARLPKSDARGERA
jgi:hypothetical protein